MVEHAAELRDQLRADSAEDIDFDDLSNEYFASWTNPSGFSGFTPSEVLGIVSVREGVAAGATPAELMYTSSGDILDIL